MAGERYFTTSHERIRRWVEERGGTPSTVAATHTEEDPGLIRIDFPGFSGEGSLEEISWDEWFEKFDESDLVLLHQETLSDGRVSNFNKLIKRETAEEDDSATWVEEEAESGAKGSSSSRSAKAKRPRRSRSRGQKADR